MPGWLYVGFVFAFVLVGVLIVRATQRRAVVGRLPLDPGEEVLLEEQGLKLYHRFRRRAVRDGGSVTYRVRARLTTRRIVLATGGPEGEHRFLLLMILDFTGPGEPVPERGSAAYRRKFHLENGYPTYVFSADDVRLEEAEGKAPALHITVPFPEAGPRWGGPPEVRLYTQQPTRYLDAIAGR